MNSPESIVDPLGLDGAPSINFLAWIIHMFGWYPQYVLVDGIFGFGGGPSHCIFVLKNPCQAANNVNCDTLLPNGQTVGDVVQQQRAALLNAMIPGTNIDNLPTIIVLSTFASIAIPGGPIDFKNNFNGQANPNLLASAGNFAYYAIGSGNLSTFALDVGAGAYGLSTAIFGSRPFSDLTGPMFSDSNAAAVRNAALASNGCSQ
jgi:hypothetical protein